MDTATNHEAHPDDDAAELAAPTAGGYRYVRGAVHYFPADDPGVALCGVSARGSIDTEASLTCETCRAGRTRIRMAWLEENLTPKEWAEVQAGARDTAAKAVETVERELEARRQAEAPAPTLPGVDAAIVEAELGA